MTVESTEAARLAYIDALDDARRTNDRAGIQASIRAHEACEAIFPQRTRRGVNEPTEEYWEALTLAFAASFSVACAELARADAAIREAAFRAVKAAR